MFFPFTRKKMIKGMCFFIRQRGCTRKKAGVVDVFVLGHVRFAPTLAYEHMHMEVCMRHRGSFSASG